MKWSVFFSSYNCIVFFLQRISTLCSPSDDLPLARQAKALKDVELKKALNRKESLTQ